VLRGLPKPTDPNLLVGTETCDDAGVYRLTDEIALVQTIDFFPPVVDDPYVYGQIAAANALSDVYAMGGVPKTALNLVGFPDKELPFEVLGRILAGGAERAAAAGCVIVGGHTVRDTEIKYGMAVTGVVHPKKVIINANAKPGDKLVLTKPLGTGHVTTAAKKRDCPEETYRAACLSMVELNKGAAEAMLEVGVNAATDITGFGLAGHAFEMATGSGVTFVLHLSALPLFPRFAELVERKHATRASKSNADYVACGLAVEGTPDPVALAAFYDAQTSGGMLMSVPAAKAEALVAACRKRNTPTAVIIGDVVASQGPALVLRP
jgi:selenide,water dikinase